MGKDQRGYIVVETIGAFLMFVFLNVSILSLINIVVVQSRIHYALTQSAQALSMYTYALEATGVAEHIVANSKQADQVGTQSDEMVGNLNKLIAALEEWNADGFKEAVNNIYGQTSGIVNQVTENPKGVFQKLLNYGLSKAGSYALGECMRPLMGWYLRGKSGSGEKFLEDYHVVDGLNGLKFYTMDTVGYNSVTNRFTSGSKNDSLLIDQNENLCLVVQYDIDYTFGALPLPDAFGGKLHVTQMVTTKAWLNGHGEGYQGERKK